MTLSTAFIQGPGNVALCTSQGITRENLPSNAPQVFNHQDDAKTPKKNTHPHEDSPQTQNANKMPATPLVGDGCGLVVGTHSHQSG